MYNNIEESFRKKHVNKTCMKVVIIILLLLAVLLIFIGNIWCQIAIEVLIILFVFCITNIYINKKVNNKKTIFKCLFCFNAQNREFIKLTANENRKNLINILKDNNVYSKEQIKEMREYYSNNKKQEYKPSTWEVLVLIISSIIAIWFGTTAMIETFSINDVIINAVVFTIFIILVILVIYSIKDLNEIYKILFDKYNVDDILERTLSEIYIDMCD